MRDGLLLIGHGTRDPMGRGELLTVASQVRALCGDVHVEPCFLELASPTIAEAIGAAYRCGVRRLTVVPCLLFAAGHAKRDIPEAVQAAAVGWEDLCVHYVPTALDCHPALPWLSELRYRQALAGRAPVPWQETALVLIGRGSSDGEATQRMHQFAQLRRQRTPVGMLHVGFIAMQTPAMDEALREILASEARRIVVQPHLLFQGELLAQIYRAAADARCRARGELIVTPHLAPGWPLARAVADLAALEFSRPIPTITTCASTSWRKSEPSAAGVRNR